jgi:hypothetical protein
VFADTNAYVAGGTIVAFLDIPLRLGDYSLNLRGSVITGRLVHEGTAVRIADGRLVGRWPTGDLLKSLDTLRDPLAKDAGAGLCGDSLTYQTAKTKICAGVDILADPKRDSTSVPCDALAMTYVFTGGQAKLGAVFSATPSEHRCGPAWADDCAR